MKTTLDRLGRFAKRLPTVLIPGDTHLGNLYVDTDGEPGVFDSLPHLATPPRTFERARRQRILRSGDLARPGDQLLRFEPLV